MRPVLRLWIFVVLACAFTAASASAHPLGNFTINHLAKITATGRALHVRYILDIAEIPTFQIMHEPGNAAWTPAISQRWADREIGIVTAGLRIAVNGSPLQLRPLGAHTRLRPGAGGLPIIRWVGTFDAPFSERGVRHVTVEDRVYSDRRIGWKDIVVGSQTEPTDELQHYPSALIGTPRRIEYAAFTAGPRGGISQVVERTDTRPLSGTLASWIAPSALSDMFSQQRQTPAFVMLTILVAFGLGALHALEPGHGKALLAFTLVGARATGKQALILAASLTVAHMAGVVLLGAVLFFAAGFVSESIYPWITLISGAVIAFIGARMLARFARIHRGQHHGHDHGTAAHDQGHSHAIPGSQPVNFKTAVWAAMSGGVAPCPAAIVVLLAALRLHQVGYGLLLIAIFSVGLAAVLSGIGIGVVHGAAWLSRRSTYSRLAPYGPLVTAVVISAIGAWTLAVGFVQQGVEAPAPLIAGIALAAMAGYAFASHGHEHAHQHFHEHTHSEVPTT